MPVILPDDQREVDYVQLCVLMSEHGLLEVEKLNNIAFWVGVRHRQFSGINIARLAYQGLQNAKEAASQAVTEAVSAFSAISSHVANVVRVRG